MRDRIEIWIIFCLFLAQMAFLVNKYTNKRGEREFKNKASHDCYKFPCDTSGELLWKVGPPPGDFGLPECL